MTIYDTGVSRSRSRVEASSFFMLLVLFLVIGTIALDAYAFSTLKL